MGAKPKTRNSKTSLAPPANTKSAPVQSSGFGLSNLTSHDDSIAQNNVKVLSIAAKPHPSTPKAKNEVKKIIMKPSVKKSSIKSILKTSKRSVNDAKPSESMLLLLGGESAKKAKNSKSLVKSAPEAVKVKEQKKSINQKVKQANIAKAKGEDQIDETRALRKRGQKNNDAE